MGSNLTSCYRCERSELHSDGNKNNCKAKHASKYQASKRPKNISLAKEISSETNNTSFTLHGVHKNSPVTPPNPQSGDNNNKKDPLTTDHHDNKTKQNSGGGLEDLFDRYKDEKREDLIGVDGIILLCEDLELEPTDFVVLIIAWKFKASVQCQFTRKEFMEGCKLLEVDSIESFKDKLPQLEEDAVKPESFENLYNFTFQYSLDIETGQRNLSTDVAVEMWSIVFTNNRPFILDDWIIYLNENKINRVSRDTWSMFLVLSSEIGDCDDYRNYDVTYAWPSVFDEFVTKQLQKIESPQESC